jgi:hypothetical protein
MLGGRACIPLSAGVALALAGTLAAARVARAHEVTVRRTEGTATVLTLAYGDGSPFQYESYEIYFDEEKAAAQVGRTDRNGRIVFVPDRPGTWRVRAFSEDGHGVDETVVVDAVAGPGRGSPADRTSRIIAGVGIILGLFGGIALFYRRRSPGLRTTAVAAILAAVPFASASPHHGVASLGTAGLEGPGAPVETSSSATLPHNRFLAYAKLDYASFQTFTRERDDEGDASAYWMYGLGYGATSWLSLYVFAPFYAKTLEDNSFTSAGFADLSVMGVVGFRFDGARLDLVPPNESLDDLEDWHFTVFAGGTIPTGDANVRNADGGIDPGMSLGFGKPSFCGGLTATRQLGALSTVFDASVIEFLENEYDDGTRTRFGRELRLNAAFPVRVLTQATAQLRLDADLELNYLSLGRDEVGGSGEAATGGRMLYFLPGARLYVRSTSLGIGVKSPTWTDLNEESDQQGAEGTEAYRLIVTFSTIL